MPAPNDKSLARSLGQFFGHIFSSAAKPVGKPPQPTQPPEPQRHEVRREVEHERVQTPQGEITLRRTTIEEVEIKPPGT